MKKSPNNLKVVVAFSIHRDAVHWATRSGLQTLCGITVPGIDPADDARPYDPAWSVVRTYAVDVTCKTCNNSVLAHRALQLGIDS